jgi:hypothetical protein
VWSFSPTIKIESFPGLLATFAKELSVSRSLSSLGELLGADTPRDGRKKIAGGVSGKLR